MHSGGHAGGTDEEDHQQATDRSVDRRRSDLGSTCVLHVETGRCRRGSLDSIDVSVLQAHSCVEKAGLIAMVRVRQLSVDEHFSLRGKTLEECIRADKEKGLIPFLVSRHA